MMMSPEEWEAMQQEMLEERLTEEAQALSDAKLVLETLLLERRELEARRVSDIARSDPAYPLYLNEVIRRLGDNWRYEPLPLDILPSDFYTRNSDNWLVTVDLSASDFCWEEGRGGYIRHYAHDPRQDPLQTAMEKELQRCHDLWIEPDSGCHLSSRAERFNGLLRDRGFLAQAIQGHLAWWPCKEHRPLDPWTQITGFAYTSLRNWVVLIKSEKVVLEVPIAIENPAAQMLRLEGCYS